jgi:hypothetical protein
MGLMTWLKSFTSVRGRVQSLYEAGMQKAKREDYEGAVRDYTAALELSDVPLDQRSMLLFNRALAYSMLKDEAKANDDLNIVVGMRGAPAHIVSAAREKLERIRRRGQTSDENR